ncbi:hypothetical protein Trco_002183 [Trichoderma cornu-damae]|uniref:Uncharacterized protein n=1 Tax=Trichoderma cornu-damae TaxID=654480 RepID=A0A9P8QUE8_9HYPO|nr:hypothetical protein Trco_002183 [Trichoderma cornu-damae]
MLPEHVPSGAARQGRDYRSTASAAKQIRFPPRRRRVRGQSNGVRKRGDASLKQQTLTQMDFISSFGEEVTLTDDDGAACDWDKLAIPRRKSKAETAEKPQESTGEDTPVVIQDSFGSSDDGDDDDLHGDASAGVSPPPFRPQFRPPFQPRHVREAVTSPYSPARMEPLDAVKASPRRRAHLSGNLEGSGRLEQRARADGSISLPAHVPSSSGEEADDREIPDSDEENEELQLQDDRLIHQDASVAGDETQLALEELASLECPKLDHAHTLTEKLPASARPSPVLASSGRVADYEPALPTEAPTFESQRVPLHVLQSFTPASARTDILLPTSSEVLNFVIDGTETFLRLAYRVPEQVRRFWLFGHDTLRYMACVQPGKPHNPGWSYHIDRVYELNNPPREQAGSCIADQAMLSYSPQVELVH